MDPLPQLTSLIQNGDPGQLGGCPALRQQGGADMLEDHIQDSKVKKKRCVCVCVCVCMYIHRITAPLGM